MTGSDFRIIKEKQLDDVVLKISQNLMSGRIFVEFNSSNPKLTLQKSFQDNLDGKMKSEVFSKSIKNVSQLKQYFGIKE